LRYEIRVSPVLASEFLAERATPEPTAELEALLVEVLERAHRAWPEVDLPDRTFARELGRKIKAREDTLVGLRTIRVEDCFLAVACGLGNAAALQHYERHYVPLLRATLGRMGLTTSEADETLQVMREELFVPKTGNEPRILNYAGRGELRGWLRAVAARTGLRTVRHPLKQVALGESIATNAKDPELECLKQTYGAAFREALVEALHEISTDDRLLLKRRFGHGLSFEEIGGLYGIHKSTAARKIEGARERLVGLLRDAVMQRLNMGRAEFSSLLPLLQSELEFTLSGIEPPLADRAAPTESPARNVQ
jgi:RNA polymerase sigma-70 factor (ECF subfamily)